MRSQRAVIIRARLCGVTIAILFLTLGPMPPASAAGTMPYPLDEFAQTFLTDAEIKALAPWGALVADTPSGQECAPDSSRGYSCVRVYPISPFGYSKPHVLSVRTFPDPASASTAFAVAAATHLGKAVNVLLDTSTEFSIEWDLLTHPWVSVGRVGRVGGRRG